MRLTASASKILKASLKQAAHRRIESDPPPNFYDDGEVVPKNYLKRPRKTPPKKRSTRVPDVISAAIWWWKQHRPVTWSERQHLAEPLVNTIGRRSKRLASEVAAFIRLSKEEKRSK